MAYGIRRRGYNALRKSDDNITKTIPASDGSGNENGASVRNIIAWLIEGQWCLNPRKMPVFRNIVLYIHRRF